MIDAVILDWIDWNWLLNEVINIVLDWLNLLMNDVVKIYWIDWNWLMNIVVNIVLDWLKLNDIYNIEELQL
jgi:hypothetical protein